MYESIIFFRIERNGTIMDFKLAWSLQQNAQKFTFTLPSYKNVLKSFAQILAYGEKVGKEPASPEQSGRHDSEGYNLPLSPTHPSPSPLVKNEKNINSW